MLMDWLQDLFFIPLVLLMLASSFSATLVYHRKHRARKPVKEIVIVGATNTAAKAVGRPTPPVKPQMTKVERAAFDAGRDDVVSGWIRWAKYPTTTEREKEAEKHRKLSQTEEGRQKLDAMRSLARMSSRHRWDPTYLYDSPSGSMRGDKTEKILAQVPTPQWSLEALREHLTDIAIYGTTSEIAGDVPAPGTVNRKRFTAAIITDRLDETYDPSKADVTAQYAYHDDHRTQARYLEGRAKGTEDIMDAITNARTRTREIGSAANALAAANKRHAAALAALRETDQPTAARDQHREYDEQARAIEEGKQ